MKYAVVLCDGMADYPVEALGGKTPMEVAKKPNIDALASKGEVGLVRTVAAGLKPRQRCCKYERARFRSEEVLHRTLAP